MFNLFLYFIFVLLGIGITKLGRKITDSKKQEKEIINDDFILFGIFIIIVGISFITVTVLHFCYFCFMLFK